MIKNVLLMSTPRSGTHMVADMLSNYMLHQPLWPAIQSGKAAWIKKEFTGLGESTEKIPYTLRGTPQIDILESVYNNNNANLCVAHLLYLGHWNKSELDRFNTIIKNLNIHVLFLDRINFHEQILSRTILSYANFRPADPKVKQQVVIKKSDLEEMYQHVIRERYHENPDKITIHQKIFYEDILENGLRVKGVDIPFVTVPDNLAVVKNPPKKDCIINYDEVLEWMDEFSKIYNGDWSPDFSWERVTNDEECGII